MALQRAKLENATQAASDDINLLFQLFNTIRRASKESQNLKAESFTIRSSDGEDLEESLRYWFASSIHDQFPHLSVVIRNRLAAAMILRKKRILYRRSRYAGAPIRPIQNVQVPLFTHDQPLRDYALQTEAENSTVSRKPKTLAKSALSISKSQTKSATTVKAEMFRIASSSSVVSTTKSVALSSHDSLTFPPAPTPQRNPSASSDKKSEKVDLEAICPYCLHALPGSMVSDEKQWR